jgi:hypothetical protein
MPTNVGLGAISAKKVFSRGAFPPKAAPTSVVELFFSLFKLQQSSSFGRNQ